MKRLITIVSFVFMLTGSAIAEMMLNINDNVRIPSDRTRDLQFTYEVVNKAIQDHMSENKQQAAADKYDAITQEDEGRVSVYDLFEVCRVGGINTRNESGFRQCKAFIEQMIADEEEMAEFDVAGYCPATGNTLKSITGEMQVGDECHSSYILYGEVVFRPGYNCTCKAYSCVDGYDLKSGACKEVVADEKGRCSRMEFPFSQYNTMKKCQAKCQESYKGKKCNYVRTALSESLGKCICNPTDDEYERVHELYLANKKKSSQYKPICSKKSSRKDNEYCIDVFRGRGLSSGGVKVQLASAVGLAQEYAKVKNNHDIWCAEKRVRRYRNDDYLMCTTKDEKYFYEFQFDSIGAIGDKAIDAGVFEANDDGIYMAICNYLYGGVWSNEVHTSFTAGNGKQYNTDKPMLCNNITADTCAKLNTSLSRFGKEAHWNNNCELGKKTVSLGSLRTAYGIDNYAFSEVKVVQSVSIQQDLIDYIKRQAEKSGYTVKQVTCDDDKNTVYDFSSLITKSFDVLTCHADGHDIDFVFKNLSTVLRHNRKGGESGMACVINDGKYTGKQCRYIEKERCEDKNFQAQIPGGCYWDDKVGLCILRDAKKAEMTNTAIKVTVGAAVTVVVTVAAAPTGVAVGKIVLAEVVASVGIDGAFEMADRTREKRPLQIVNQFLADSEHCSNVDCAYDLLTKYIASFYGMCEDVNNGDCSVINDEKWNQVMARLDALAALLPQGGPTDAETAKTFYNAVKYSGTLTQDKLLNVSYAGILFFGVATNPSKAVSKTGRFARGMEHVLDASMGVVRAGGRIENIAMRYGAKLRQGSSTLNGESYYRIMVENKSMMDIQRIVDELQREGMYVSSNMVEGKQFIAFSDKNIFSAWANAPSNWLFGAARFGGKLGNELAAELANKFKGGWVSGNRFFFNSGQGKQCATGLKFHVSVAKDDLEKAATIINDVVSRHGIADQWKVHIDGMRGGQLGKDFTIYVSPGNDNVARLGPFVQDLERNLKFANIRSNGFGANIQSGDMAIAGSNYINYRYDRVDMNGIPSSGYNSSYNFVAPRPEYGGDVMQGVRVY